MGNKLVCVPVAQSRGNIGSSANINWLKVNLLGHQPLANIVCNLSLTVQACARDRCPGVEVAALLTQDVRGAFQNVRGALAAPQRTLAF